MFVIGQGRLSQLVGRFIKRVMPRDNLLSEKIVVQNSFLYLLEPDVGYLFRAKTFVRFVCKMIPILRFLFFINHTNQPFYRTLRYQRDIKFAALALTRRTTAR